MIDWYSLTANALWILGLTLGLATLSYASWQATIFGEKLKVRLGLPPMQISINFAGALFCLGLAATADSGLEIGLWLVLAVAFLVQIIVVIRGKI